MLTEILPILPPLHADRFKLLLWVSSDGGNPSGSAALEPHFHIAFGHYFILSPAKQSRNLWDEVDFLKKLIAKLCFSPQEK